MRDSELFGLLCACGSGIAVVLAASALLMLAVAITNKLVRPTRKETHGEWGDWDWDDWDDEYEPLAPKSKPAIPALGLGKAVIIVVLSALVTGLGFVLVGFAAEGLGLRMRREETRFAVLLLNLPLTGLTLTILLLSMLPTKFWRAAMVAFVYGVLFLAFGTALGVVIYAAAVVFD